MRTFLIACVLALSSACASQVLIPVEDRAGLERDLTGRDRDKFLRLSFYVTPFFGDASKRLLTAVPPDEVRMLDQPSGEPVLPGPVQRVLPAGTRARIAKVEFATPFAITERIPYTPRTQPWVFLEVEGEPRGAPLVLVLRQQLRTQAEFLAELERYLVSDDPAQKMAAWTDTVREAVRTKHAVVDMPAEALEMAWGYPERKRIRFEDAAKQEEWLYPGRKRVAHLSEGRVV